MKQIANGLFIGKRADGGVSVTIYEDLDATVLLADIVVAPEQWQEALEYLNPTPAEDFVALNIAGYTAVRDHNCDGQDSGKIAVSDGTAEDSAEKGSSDAGDNVMIEE